jgi:hypothetical protein
MIEDVEKERHDGGRLVQVAIVAATFLTLFLFGVLSGTQLSSEGASSWARLCADTLDCNPDSFADAVALENLVAQRSVAFWAAWSVAAAAMSSVVSATGVWLVWRTLNATRDGTAAAVRAAREAAAATKIAQDSRRPWVDFTLKEITGPSWGPKSPVTLNIVVTNIGHSPAVATKMFAEIYTGMTAQHGEVASRLRQRLAEWPHKATTLMPQASRTMQEYAAWPADVFIGHAPGTVKKFSLSVCVVAQYLDQSGDKRYTSKNYLVMAAGGVLLLPFGTPVLPSSHSPIEDSNRASYT